MRSTRTRRLIAAATTAFLFATLAACGGDDAEPAAEGETAASSPAPSESEPAEEPSEPAAGEEVDAQQLLDDMKAAIEGQQSAHLTMELTGGSQQMSGEGDVSYAGDKTAMRLSMGNPEGAGTMEIRLIDKVLYISIPPMTPKGKFVQLDLNDPNSPFGDLSGAMTGDPLNTFDAFDAGLQKVAYLGEEEVGGETLHHYLLTVDAKKAAEAQGRTFQPGPEVVTYDLWLDDQNLMRRIEFEQTRGSLVMTMSDWGEPVTVEAPPASDVMDMPSGPPAQG
jgi:hypothetical protein